MSQQGHPAQTTTHLFDAAKAIVEALKDLDRTSQARAIRFAGETLGLQEASIGHISAAPDCAWPSSAAEPVATALSHTTDIKQFTAVKAPKSDMQFAAVVAYFYRFEAPEAERSNTVDAKTLLKASRLAGRKRPPVPTATLQNAKNAGYLDVVSRGCYSISSVGENLVAMALPADGAGATSARSAGKSRRAKKKAPRKKPQSKKATRVRG